MKAKPEWWVDYIASIRQFQTHMANCGDHLERTEGEKPTTPQPEGPGARA